MPVAGVTGGIGTGKSTLARALAVDLPAEIFDADQAAHELLAADPAVQEAVRARFGDGVFTPEGIPDRAKLRAAVFGQEEERRALEAILHPEIRKRWVQLAAERRQDSAWLIVDIPLLYEAGAESYFDCVIVVACTPATQRRRLREHRRLEEAMIERILGAQFDLSIKITKADHVIWNDSTVSCLHGQSRLLAHRLRLPAASS